MAGLIKWMAGYVKGGGGDDGLVGGEVVKLGK